MRVVLRQHFGIEKICIELDVRDSDNVEAADRSRISTPDEEPWGLFSRIGNDLVALFSLQGRLYLCLNAKVAAVPDNEIPVSHSKKGDLRELRIRFGLEEHVLTYKTSEPVVGPAYAEVEEDVDFGLWLCNVLGSDERRDILIKAWRRMHGDGKEDVTTVLFSQTVVG